MRDGRNKLVDLEMATTYSCRIWHRVRVCGYVAVLS